MFHVAVFMGWLDFAGSGQENTVFCPNHLVLSPQTRLEHVPASRLKPIQWMNDHYKC